MPNYLSMQENVQEYYATGKSQPSASNSDSGRQNSNNFPAAIEWQSGWSLSLVWFGITDF